MSEVTLWRVTKRFVEQGLEAALQRKTQARPKPTKLDGVQEAHLIALACSEPPDGRARWPLHLRADRLVELGYVESLSYETMRQVLQRGESSPGLRNGGAFPRKPTASS